MENNTKNTLLTFLAGAAAGALAGVLFAPQKGSKTREDIASTAKEYSEKLQEKGVELSSFVEENKEAITNEIVKLSKEAVGKTNSAAAKLKSKISDIKQQLN